MEFEFINELLKTHGTSGVVSASIAWFVIKKLPKLIERHLDSVDKHFAGITKALTDLSSREDERHRELISYIQESKKK